MDAEKAEKLKHQQRLTELFNSVVDDVSDLLKVGRSFCHPVLYTCTHTHACVTSTQNHPVHPAAFFFTFVVKADKASLFIVGDDQLWAQVRLQSSNLVGP